MRKDRLHQTLATVLLSLAVVLMPMQTANACSRAVYLGPEDTTITIRSMDWEKDIGSNLWVFPRGIKRDGAAGSASVRWESKYGSVVASAFDGLPGGIGATSDGMNERGLVANLLALPETEYPQALDRRMCVSIWTQYFLDNYATVVEAVGAIKQEPVYVVPWSLGDKGSKQHLSISDPTGDSAIFEYIDGKVVIYHSRDYRVMTNSPPYKQQLAINAYWEKIGGINMLPGTHRSTDRFVRASFYIHTVPKTSNDAEAIAIALSVIRGVSVPLGISTPGKPHISSTRWRTVSDQKSKRYYFDSTHSLNVFWVDLNGLNFTKGAPVRELKLKNVREYVGDMTKHFQPAKQPLQFAKCDPENH